MLSYLRGGGYPSLLVREISSSGVPTQPGLGYPQKGPGARDLGKNLKLGYPRVDGHTPVKTLPSHIPLRMRPVYTFTILFHEKFYFCHQRNQCNLIAAGDSNNHSFLDAHVTRQLININRQFRQCSPPPFLFLLSG